MAMLPFTFEGLLLSSTLIAYFLFLINMHNDSCDLNVALWKSKTTEVAKQKRHL